MSFSRLLPDSVTIEPYTGSDGYGAPQFGSGVSYKARIEWGPKDVKNPAGEEVVSNARIFIATANAIDTRSKITLPVGRGPVNPPIIMVRAVTSGRRVHHTVVYV